MASAATKTAGMTETGCERGQYRQPAMEAVGDRGGPAVGAAFTQGEDEQEHARRHHDRPEQVDGLAGCGAGCPGA